MLIMLAIVSTSMVFTRGGEGNSSEKSFLAHRGEHCFEVHEIDGKLMHMLAAWDVRHLRSLPGLLDLFVNITKEMHIEFPRLC